MRNDEYIVKPVFGFDGYEVTNTGLILRDGHSLAFKINKDSVQRVGIYNGRKQYFRFVHRLVAQAFIPNPENKPCVCFLSPDTLNCSANNLIWATWEEVREKAQCAAILSGKTTSINNHLSKPVKMIRADGREINYKSVSDAARINNYDQANINQAANGVYEFAYGLKWEFI